MSEAEFKKWSSIPRLVNDEFTITEKLDGTNGQILIEEDGTIHAGSRSQWLSAANDNFGFYTWIQDRRESIVGVLSPGRYYGEFIGKGIQRKYGLNHNRFYLFNVSRKDQIENSKLPELGIFTVPVIQKITLSNYGSAHSGTQGLSEEISNATINLRLHGSMINNYPHPEGLIIFSDKTKSLWKSYVYEEVPKQGK